MPRMTGIEPSAQRAVSPKFEHLPVIIASYKDREEDRMMALAARLPSPDQEQDDCRCGWWKI